MIIHFHSHIHSPIYIDTYLFSGNDSGDEEHPRRGILPKELSPRFITQSLARISYSPSFISSPKFYTKSVLYTDPVLAYCNNKLKQLHTCLYP